MIVIYYMRSFKVNICDIANKSKIHKYTVYVQYDDMVQKHRSTYIPRPVNGDMHAAPVPTPAN